MKISRIDIYKLNLAFRKPLKVAIGETLAVENVAIKITTDSGLEGWGEASPCCPYITGDLQATCYATARISGV